MATPRCRVIIARISELLAQISGISRTTTSQHNCNRFNISTDVAFMQSGSRRFPGSCLLHAKRNDHRSSQSGGAGPLQHVHAIRRQGSGTEQIGDRGGARTRPQSCQTRQPRQRWPRRRRQPRQSRRQTRVATFFLGVWMGWTVQNHGLECGGQPRHRVLESLHCSASAAYPKT